MKGGLEIAAMTATHQSQQQEVILGPDRGVFRYQIVIKELDHLLREAAKGQASEFLDSLESKRFYAIHHGPLPRHKPNRNNNNRYWNEFTIHGPIIGRGKPIEQQLQYWAYDEPNGRLYLAQRTQLTILNIATGASEQLNLNEKDRQLVQDGLHREGG